MQSSIFFIIIRDYNIKDFPLAEWKFHLITKDKQIYYYQYQQKGFINMADFKYEIVEHIGILSESAKGWTKELNKISWNGGEPKYDIRDWAPEHEKMGKGVTLSEDEMVKLKELL